jgi:hypothetical protein
MKATENGIGIVTQSFLRNPILDQAAFSGARKGREGGLDRKRVAHVGGYYRRRFI